MRVRSRELLGAVAVAGLAFAIVPVSEATGSDVSRRRVDGRVSDWRGETSGFGGTWQYSAGEFVYQDHLFDDLGANTGQRSQQRATTGAPRGDFRYPFNEQRYGFNAADFLELRFAADAAHLWVLARMSTLKVRDATVVAVAIDTDRSAKTGGGTWPHASGLAVPGADVVITLWGTGGTVTRLPDGSPVRIADVAVDISNANNAIEARIPRKVIGRGSVIRAWAAAGLWDARASEWMAIPAAAPTAAAPGGGSPRVAARAFNVAFRRSEGGSYMEDKQADALESGDISSFRADVDLGVLAARGSRPFKVKPGRFYAVIIDEKVSLAPQYEGVSYSGEPGRFAGVGGAALAQSFHFYGRHQPYGLYVPSTYGGRKRLPAALVLHGLGGSHSSYNSQPGFLADMGEGEGSGGSLPPMFLITPLARGSSFYADWGEADTLAVLDDVQRRFHIDADRLYLTGYSMGGYGVYRLASLYPDRFAAAGVWAGYTGEFLGAYLTSPRTLAGDPTGQADAITETTRPVTSTLGVGGGRQGKANIGDPVDTLENLRHLPLVHLAGTNDEIVPTPGQYAAGRRLAELGYRSRFDLYPGYEHLTFAIVDDWKQVRAWLGNSRRETEPRDIVYKFSDGWTLPGLAPKLGLRHGDVWWLRGLAMRKHTDDALALATIKATSRGVPARSEPVAKGMTPATAPTPHIQQLVSWGTGERLRTENRLDLFMEGVGKATVQMGRARLRPCGLVLDLSTDGRAVVRLNGSFPPGSQVFGLKRVSARVEESGALVVVVAAPVDGKATVRCLSAGGQAAD